MATSSFIDKGPSIDWSTDENLYSRFKMWKQRCELLFTGPMGKIDEEVKCKHLLYWSGERGIELFNSWDLSAEQEKKLDNYWERFENFVKPHSNELIAAWELYNLRQGTLSLEEFIARLRILLKEANYPVEHNERFLRDFLVLGMNSDRVRKDCFKVGNALTFKEAREMAKSEESADKQLQLMNTEVHPISTSRGYQGQRNQRQTPNTGAGKPRACRNCGWGPHPREQCPAKNATCHYCHKVGHLAKVCLSKLKNRDVHDIKATSDDTNELMPDPSQISSDHMFLGPVSATPLTNGVHAISCKEKSLLEVCLALEPEGKQTRALCKIDSGAETNIIPKSLYNQLSPRVMNLHKPTMKLTAYGGSEIPNLGSCQVYIKGPNNPNPKLIQAEVVDVDGPAIIGNMSAQSLNLLKLNWAVSIESTNKTTAQPSKLFDVRGKPHPFPLTKEYLLKEYEDVFTGIGCFPGPPYHIETDQDVPPVQHPPRQVPIQLQDAYQEELEGLIQAGILLPIHDEYTPWVNSTVVTTKPNGTIRLCLDPRDLNKAIQRTPYYVRTIDDVIPKVSGASHFSILDARSGFWQVELDDESSKLCTFSTPWGKYRWKRLPFGLTCSGDVFQEKMDTVFGKLDGLSGIADDTFVYGKSEVEHDQHILNILDTARDNNVRFNPDKFQFKVDQTSFFGFTWTPDGLRADDLKIKAIRDMPSPQSLSELQTFMGMVNYLNRFSPVITQTSEPLRQLMKKGTPFVWQPEHTKAFQSLKQIITEAPVLAYYDPEKDNVIQSDASQRGLGCVLMQDGKPVCYASRSLSDTESRYSNIERELLAACWSLERFNHYVFGKQVLIETDHKPLESIWKKNIPSASPRLQRLLLKMAKYNVELEYIKGKTNVIADALSRVCCMENPDKYQSVPLLEVDAITSTLPASPAKLNEIRDYTSQDIVLSHLKDVIHQGWPEYPNECPPDLKEYWNFREDLSVENGLILKGHRLLVPSNLRPQMLQIIHQGHLGAEKCNLKARDCVFWPGISKDINQMTDNCPTCMQFSKRQSKEPLHPHSVPSFPWQKLGTDLFDYQGAQYLLVTDYYSKYPVVRKLNSATSAAVINHLKSIFAEHGIPETLVSDNGPQYSSQEFAAFCKQWGIDHVTSSPLYPQSNGFIERSVQTVKNLLRKAEASGQDPYLALLTYRTTPVDSNLPSPAQLLNHRDYRTQLPCSGRLQRTQALDSHKEQLQNRQDIQRKQYDSKSTHELRKLNQGEQASMFQHRTKTWTPVEVKGVTGEPRSYIIKTADGSELRRNRVQLKPVSKLPPLCTEQVASDHDSLPTDENMPKPSAPQSSPPKLLKVPIQSPVPPCQDGTNLPMTTRSGRIVKMPSRLDL